MAEQLTAPDEAELADREARIAAALERGRAADVEVGRELEAIRLGRLYRTRGYASFDAYLRQDRQLTRGTLERSRALQLMHFARVCEILAPIGTKLPASEAVARELAPLTPAAPRVEGDDRGGTHGWRPSTVDYLIEAWRAALQDPRRMTAPRLAEHVKAKLRELEAAGIRPAPVSAKPTKADVIERIRAAPVTVQPGDLYALGPHRLICGDATWPPVYERLLGTVRPDLLFTDPPYNQSYGGGGGKHPLDAIPGDDLSDDDAADLLTSAFLSVFLHLAADAAGYVCAPSADPLLLARFAEILGALEKLQSARIVDGPEGWTPQTIVWNKGSMGFGPEHGYRYQHEAILHMRGASEWYASGNEQQDAEDVWTVPRAPTPYIHPNQKPVELAQRAMINSTLPGATVLDPFLGSGSTVIAARLLARRYGDAERPVYGIELDPGELEKALGWIEHQTGYSRELLERAPAEDAEERPPWQDERAIWHDWLEDRGELVWLVRTGRRDLEWLADAPRELR